MHLTVWWRRQIREKDKIKEDGAKCGEESLQDKMTEDNLGRASFYEDVSLTLSPEW